MRLEIIVYTLMGIGLYFVSDWILNRVEVSRGERFKNRNIIFFLIILTLAFLSFSFTKFLLLAAG
ncbi:hypothetical protein [Polaromonas sp.]|uniref:hypothetical protein n=1 Tax=Polaromonas sp. TaxID=1869339 RepID=UPI00273172BB|nr:hypothetical protein [Polaromonas sp.]MDP1742438.1 hypothetical protein [Polaromonas sp.]